MAKLKTNSGAKKRFALTGSGKIKRKHAYHSHILTKKTKKRKRNLDHFTILHKDDVKRVKEASGPVSFFMFNLERSRKASPRGGHCLRKKINLCQDQ